MGRFEATLGAGCLPSARTILGAACAAPRPWSVGCSSWPRWPAGEAASAAATLAMGPGPILRTGACCGAPTSAASIWSRLAVSASSPSTGGYHGCGIPSTPTTGRRCWTPRTPQLHLAWACVADPRLPWERRLGRNGLCPVASAVLLPLSTAAWARRTAHNNPMAARRGGPEAAAWGPPGAIQP